MSERHNKLAAVARTYQMTPAEHQEQLINLAHGNLPEEAVGEPIELMEAAHRLMGRGGLALFLKS